MKVTKQTKKEVTEMAHRFIRHQPPVCESHMPDGLPIDAPEGVEVSENHPAYKFEKLVEEEVKTSNKSKPDSVLRAEIRHKLRAKFAEVYHSKCDERSCVQCYDDNKSEEKDDAIRMVVPDDYDEIPDR